MYGIACGCAINVYSEKILKKIRHFAFCLNVLRNCQMLPKPADAPTVHFQASSHSFLLIAIALVLYNCNLSAGHLSQSSCDYASTRVPQQYI